MISFGRYRRRNTTEIKLRYIWSGISGKEFDGLTIMDRQVRRLGLKLSRGQLEELAQLWYQPVADQARIEPELHRHLQALQDMPVKLAIISNTFSPAAVLDRQLREFDLLKFFPVRVYSSVTVFRKPHRRIFQRALDELGVSASAAVMVGDKIRPDIRGARQLGIKPVFKRGVTNNTKRVGEDVAVIDSIAELPELVRRWRQS